MKKQKLSLIAASGNVISQASKVYLRFDCLKELKVSIKEFGGIKKCLMFKWNLLSKVGSRG